MYNVLSLELFFLSRKKFMTGIILLFYDRMMERYKNTVRYGMVTVLVKFYYYDVISDKVHLLVSNSVF